MNFILARDFSLKHSLECGQFFRYKKIGEFYYVHSADILFKAKQDGDKIYYKFAENNKLGNKKLNEAEFLKRFFRLDDNLKDIKKAVVKDKHLREAFSRFKGLRLIRQEPWECTISYLCSSASNIPKIQKNIELLSKTFGKKIKLDYYEGFTFPEKGKINDMKKIKKCGVGFRARYILEANSKLKDIERLKNVGYIKAKNELMKNKGIGEKIADCICLFSLNKNEAFPVDVWMKKVMNKLYLGEKVNSDEIRRFARNYFGKNAGYAQQYLFYMIRNR